MIIQGRIIEQNRRGCRVETERGTMHAVIRGRVRKEMTVYPGDLVDLDLDAAGPDRPVIVRRHERTAFLPRPAVANMELVVVIATLKEPPPDCDTLDRLLFCASVNGIAAAVAFNKRDLLDGAERSAAARMSDYYRRIGYPGCTVSARTGENLGELRALCGGRICCFAGKSGVGKSTLLAGMFPGREFRIGDMSARGGRGMHTTTTTTLIRLPEGGYIADTPGFSELTPPRVAPEEVCYYYPEFEACIGSCRFATCVHDTEPGCVVKERTASGEIPHSRYASYLALFREMRRRAGKR